MLMILINYVIKLDIEMIKDYSYYYVTKDKVKNQYILSNFLITLVFALETECLALSL